MGSQGSPKFMLDFSPARARFDRLLRQRGGPPIKQSFQRKGGGIAGALRLAGRIAGLSGFELGRVLFAHWICDRHPLANWAGSIPSALRRTRAKDRISAVALVIYGFALHRLVHICAPLIDVPAQWRDSLADALEHFLARLLGLGVGEADNLHVGHCSTTVSWETRKGRAGTRSGNHTRPISGVQPCTDGQGLVAVAPPTQDLVYLSLRPAIHKHTNRTPASNSKPPIMSRPSRPITTKAATPSKSNTVSDSCSKIAWLSNRSCGREMVLLSNKPGWGTWRA